MLLARGINLSQKWRSKEDELSKKINNSIDDALKGVEGGEDLKKALKDVVNAVKEGNADEVKIVSFRKFKELFPNKIEGMKREGGEGSTNAVLGMKASNYETKYINGDQLMKIRIMDTGGLGKAIMGAVPWATVEVDKETENGYERTTEYKGHKAFEKYDEKTQGGNLAILIDKRFVLNIEGENVKMKTRKKAADKIGANRVIRLGEQAEKED